MPIYEYQCTACRHKLEALQKFSDAPLVTCPQCAQDTLTKLVSAAGFQLKGSGWYQTDFRGGGTKAPAKTDAVTGETKTSDAAPAKADTSSAKPEASTAKTETSAAAASPPSTAA